MSKRNIVIPEAREALNRLKYEIANESGSSLENNAIYEMTSYQYGTMVKRMIEAQEKQMADQFKS